MNFIGRSLNRFLFRVDRHKGDLKAHAKCKHGEDSALVRSISRAKSTKLDKEHACPVASCNCGYEGRRELLRHLRNKHNDIFLEIKNSQEWRKPQLLRDSPYLHLTEVNTDSSSPLSSISSSSSCDGNASSPWTEFEGIPTQTLYFSS